MSAPLITRTWEQPRVSGPSRFFALSVWEAVRPDTVLERSCHQWYCGMGLQSSLNRDTTMAQGGLQQFPRQLAKAECCRQVRSAAGQWSLQWPRSKGVDAGGFLNNSKPPGSPEQHQCHGGCIPAVQLQHSHRFPRSLVPSPRNVSSRSCRGTQGYLILHLPKDFAFAVTQDPTEAAVVGQSVKWLCRSQDTVTPE